MATNITGGLLGTILAVELALTVVTFCDGLGVMTEAFAVKMECD